MMSPSECWWCNEPATYTFLVGMQTETLCDRCARDKHAHTRGAADAGLAILAAAVKALRDAGLTDQEIVAATRDAAVSAAAFSDPVAPEGPIWAQGGFDFDNRFVPSGSDA